MDKQKSSTYPGRISQAMVGVLPAVAVLIAWEVFTAGSRRRQFLFAAPSLVIRVAREEFASGRILADIGITAGETLVGLTFGTIIGGILGLALWANRSVARVVQPYVILAGSIPVFAIAPMLIIWFGTGYLPKVVMAGFPVALLSLVQVYQGTQRIDESHREWLWGLSVPRRTALLYVILPESLRVIVEGARANVGFALVGAFIGEFMVAQAGLGYFVLRSGGLYDMPRVILGLSIFAALGWLFSFAGSILEHIVLGRVEEGS